MRNASIEDDTDTSPHLVSVVSEKRSIHAQRCYYFLFFQNVNVTTYVLVVSS
jgi:hypothetical protein